MSVLDVSSKRWKKSSIVLKRGHFWVKPSLNLLIYLLQYSCASSDFRPMDNNDEVIIWAP